MSLFDLERFYRPAQRPLFQPVENAPQGVPRRTRACEDCGKDIPENPRCIEGHRFCSSVCRVRAYRKVLACGPRDEPQGPEIRRLHRASLKILGRLQDGPALAAELVACGGGYRYGARLLELRQAGHNIEAISKGEGVWEYRLILP